jgi:hypothetical protein
MSQNSDFVPLKQPLSISNVIIAALRIYRDRFQIYYILAFKAWLWSFIPIYGWAKFSTILGLISRLAYCEVAETPESVEDARNITEPKKWIFLITDILASLLFIGVTISSILLFGILIGLSKTFFVNNPILLIVLILCGLIAGIIGYFQIISRLFLIKLPIALEHKNTADSAIKYSWNLTKRYASEILGIVFVAFLLTLPICMAIYVFIGIFTMIFTFAITNSPVLELIANLILIAMNIASSALIIPFWQTIQAIIYYHIKNQVTGNR